MTLINDGTVTGGVLLGNPLDKFVAQGGIVNGTIFSPTGDGQVEIDADTRVNGAIASSTGATPGDRSSVDLDLNFGVVTFTSDASLNVGHDPNNAALNSSVFFSHVAADLRNTQDGQGTVNYLFETDIRQSVGTGIAGLKALNFLSGASSLTTSSMSYFVADTTIGSGAKLTLIPDASFTNHGGVSKPGNGNVLSGNVTVNGILDLGS